MITAVLRVAALTLATHLLPIVPADAVQHPFPIVGFNINLYGRNRLNDAPNLPNTLDQLAATGSNTALVTSPYFQATNTSNEIFADPTITETDDDLVVLFASLQIRGVRAAYKFTVIPQDGSWSGAIKPSNPAVWFASYQAHLVRLAALCQTHGVTLLYIANEMQSMAKPAYAAQWNTVIDAVRTVYSGELAWNAVLGRNLQSEAFTLPIASRLDHIGLSVYEPLTNKMDPTVDELVAAWYSNRLGINLVAMVKSLHAMTGKPIVFSEMSYRSVDGNNIDPGNWEAKPGDVPDPQEQADCYEAFMRVWTTENQSWMLGVLWWVWLIDPEFGPANNQSPQSLPAQALITRWFGGTLPTTTLAAAVLPSSRAVRVGGGVATAFATLINTGSMTAFNVGISPALQLPAKFSYQTTNCSSNMATGTSNAPTYIPAGQRACFVFAVEPTGPFEPVELPLVFAGDNTSAVLTLAGINTLLVSASMVPGPDIVALGATTTNDGIANIPGTTGTGFFSVATVNVGAGAPITATVDTGSGSLSVVLSLCQTNPATGACINPATPGSSATVQIDANQTPTFAVFVRGTGNVPFLPGVNRTFVRFKTAGGATVGATSVAIRTQ